MVRLIELAVGVSNPDNQLAERLLTAIEAAGMAPPPLGGDRGQVIIHTYVFPQFHMWDEQFEADPVLVKALARRQELAAETPEQRVARSKAAVARLNRRDKT